MKVGTVALGATVVKIHIDWSIKTSQSRAPVSSHTEQRTPKCMQPLNNYAIRFAHSEWTMFKENMYFNLHLFKMKGMNTAK